MKISSKYQNEYLAIRYGVQMQSSNLKVKAEGFKNLIELCKKMNWIYLQEELVRSARGESCVVQHISNTLIESTVEARRLKTLDNVDRFFVKLYQKDIPTKSNKIKEYADKYFSYGKLSQYINIFTRFIKNIKDLTESELHEFVIKFVVASVIKKNYEFAVSDINFIKAQYSTVDLNIYIFLMRFFNGNMSEAADLIFNIGKDIYDEVWKLVSESDLTFYFLINLLVIFRRKRLRDVQSFSNTLVYRLMEERPDYVNILENYSKCRYGEIVDQLDKITKTISEDPLTANQLKCIHYEVKISILREILQSCQVVKIDYLSKILHEENDIVENWVLGDINDSSLKVKIDDVNKVIHSVDERKTDKTVEKTLEFTKRMNNETMEKLLASVVNGKVDKREIDLGSFKMYSLETGSSRGGMEFSDEEID